MRVLIVSEDIPHPQLGGLGKHALNLAQALAARGHSVDLMGNAKHPIARHPDQAGPGRFIPALEGYERGWKQQGLGVFHAFATGANARPLRDAILRHAPGYDVVHYHGHLPWVAAQLPDELPFVQTRHDQGGDCMLKIRFNERRGDGPCHRLAPQDCAACATTATPNALQRQVSAHAVRHMRAATARAYERHAVVFVSDFLRRNFERAVGKPVQAQVIPNAVEVAQLADVVRQARTIALDPPAGLRLFMAGALFAYKGFGPMLEALARSSARGGRDFKLQLAGSGPLEAELRSRHASARIEFLGWRAYPDVIGCTLAADAVIVPSLCEESCATSALEALALGKTVYALRAGGTPEMLAYADSAGGALRLFDSLDALADAALAHKNSEPAGVAQPSRFTNSVARMTEQVEGMYAELIARHAQTRKERSL